MTAFLHSKTRQLTVTFSVVYRHCWFYLDRLLAVRLGDEQLLGVVVLFCGYGCGTDSHWKMSDAYGNVMGGKLKLKGGLKTVSDKKKKKKK